MPSRPPRSAATKAKETISVHARWTDSSDRGNTNTNTNTSTNPTMSSRRSNRVVRDEPDDSHLDVTVKVPSGKLRQATRGSSRRADSFEGGEIVYGKRDRGGKKKYVVDSSPDDDEEDEEEAQIEDDEDDDMDEDGDEDAEGEDDMDVDAEGGEEDAEGDVDMDVPRRATGPTIKISRASSKPSARAATTRVVPDDDDDDEELSEPADSDAGDQTLGYGDENDGDDGDEDAEGEEIEVVGEDEGEGGGGGNEQGLGSDEEGSEEGEPDLAKMTKRQRARFEDGPQEFMKLSDEVQAKKVFTAEELSMRRQEMARRRRNLSEKRNEEVKMETINKLLKKQAPKVNKKAAAAAAAAEGTPEDEATKTNPIFIRWTSGKDGSHVAIPPEMVDGPAGQVFRPSNEPAPRKRVEEVA